MTQRGRFSPPHHSVTFDNSMYYNLNVIICLPTVHQMTEKQPKERENGVTMKLHLPVRAENARVHPPAQLAGIITCARYVTFCHIIVCPQILLITLS